MSELIIKDGEDDITPTFEDFKNENGITYWWASDLMKMLGFKDIKGFQPSIDRATKACISLGIPHYENFIAHQRIVDGVAFQDFKLTRFACYLTVMNSDPKKKEVAAAQVYFVEQTRKFEIISQNPDDFERILIRDEVKDGNKALFSTAKSAGVQDYAKFVNAGYLGMYNTMNTELAKRRKVDPKDLTEYMGRTELAANLFRITQTEERIKNFNITGQRNLEQTHYKVGKEVRGIVTNNTGKAPEQLPQEKKLPELRKEMKEGYKKMLKADNKKNTPKKK